MIAGPVEEGTSSVSDDSDRAAWLRRTRSYLRNADPVLAEIEALSLDLLEVRQLTSDREPPRGSPCESPESGGGFPP